MIRKAVHDTNALLIITILFGILSIPLDMIFQRKIQIFDLVQTFLNNGLASFTVCMIILIIVGWIVPFVFILFFHWLSMSRAV